MYTKVSAKEGYVYSYRLDMLCIPLFRFIILIASYMYRMYIDIDLVTGTNIVMYTRKYYYKIYVARSHSQ